MSKHARIAHVWLSLSALLLITGCRSIPFEPTEKVPVGNADPQRVVERLAETMPENYQVVNSVVFHYYWKTFSALGWLKVDRPQDSFTLTAMTPMGVKLFSLQGEGTAITCPFAMEEFTKRGDFASVVGRDIREIYLDLIPGKDATVRRQRYALVYRDVKADGRIIRYTIGGPGQRLMRKQGMVDGDPAWTVDYYEYFEREGKWYPRGIMLRHHLYNYSFEIRIKEFM